MSALIHLKSGEVLSFVKILMPHNYLAILNNEKFIEFIIPLGRLKDRKLIIFCSDIVKIDFLDIKTLNPNILN